jgi:CO/xanthine dehydrogenase Mo-binding subunit
MAFGHLPFPPIVKRADGSPMAAPPRTLLAEGRALYVGQPVVAIVAQTRNQAQDAADLAVVEYEDLPCVTDAREAAKKDAPQIWPQAPATSRRLRGSAMRRRSTKRSGARARHEAFAAQPAPDRDGA